jgi:hypothetical protein
MSATEMDQVLRSLAAAGAGVVVGFNRELRGKPQQTELTLKTVSSTRLCVQISSAPESWRLRKKLKNNPMHRRRPVWHHFS